MERTEIYRIVKAAFAELTDRGVSRLPETPEEGALLVDCGVDVMTLGALEHVLESKLEGKSLALSRFAPTEVMIRATVGDLLSHLEKMLKPDHPDPLMVYVDDEEQNLFIFRRRFGNKFKLKMFSDPREALEFIITNEEVKLVVTDEVMPGMRGNELCEKVKHVRPKVSFILMTANPENDNGLLFKSLRHNRFYDFIQKPVDFDKEGEQCAAMFRRLLDE